AETSRGRIARGRIAADSVRHGPGSDPEAGPLARLPGIGLQAEAGDASAGSANEPRRHLHGGAASVGEHKNTAWHARDGWRHDAWREGRGPVEPRNVAADDPHSGDQPGVAVVSHREVLESPGESHLVIRANLTRQGRDQSGD